MGEKHQRSGFSRAVLWLPCRSCPVHTPFLFLHRRCFRSRRPKNHTPRSCKKHRYTQLDNCFTHIYVFVRGNQTGLVFKYGRLLKLAVFFCGFDVLTPSLVLPACFHCFLEVPWFDINVGFLQLLLFLHSVTSMILLFTLTASSISSPFLSNFSPAASPLAWSVPVHRPRAALQPEISLSMFLMTLI